MYKKDASKKYNHEIIITPNKKNLEAVIANKPEFNLYFASVAYSNNKSNEKSYRDLIVHELCHSVAMNDADTYKDLLSKFDEINKNIVGNRTLREIKEDLHNPELKRPKGCVSSYLVSSRYIGEGKVLSEFENKAKYENGECIAEVMTYIALNLDYANDDPVVQEKIKIVKDFLAESNDNEKKDNEEKETKIKLVESDAENLKNQTKNKAEKVKEQKYKSIGLGLDKDKIGEGFPFPDISDLFDKK